MDEMINQTLSLMDKDTCAFCLSKGKPLAQTLKCLPIIRDNSLHLDLSKKEGYLKELKKINHKLSKDIILHNKWVPVVFLKTNHPVEKYWIHFDEVY